MKQVPLLLSSTLACASALSAQAPGTLRPALRDSFAVVTEPVVALTHVRVVDGTGAPPTEDHTIVIAAGKIQAVGRSGSVQVPSGARVMDLTGKTVIPGIVGLHDHTFYGGADWPYVHLPVSAPRLYLASGVTTIRTTGSTAPYQDLNLKRSVDLGEAVGPRMYITGPYITGAGGGEG